MGFRSGARVPRGIGGNESLTSVARRHRRCGETQIAGARIPSAMNDSLDVKGGFAGASARIEDLERASRALALASGALEDCAARLALIDGQLSAWTVVPSPEALVCQLTISGAEEARAHTLREAAQADRVSRRLAHVAHAYQAADAGAHVLVAGLRDIAIRIGWHISDRWRALTSPFENPTALVMDTPRLMPMRDALDSGLGAMAHTFSLILSHVSASLRTLTALLSGAFTLHTTSEKTHQIEPSTGMQDLMQAVRDVSPEGGGEPGTLSIDTVTHPDGSRTYIVSIPGTQEWLSLMSENVFDVTGAVTLAAGHVSDSALAVAAAMREAEIPPDAPVMLVGHSQGGMAAMALANDPAFRERFHVVSVATAGAPVGRHQTPSGVAVMHLEHSEDAVPGLDGARNPDGPTRVTISRDLAHSDNPADVAAARGEVAYHRTDTYVRTAALVDSSDHASIEQWRRESTVFFPDEGSTADRTIYAVARERELVVTTPGVTSGASSRPWEEP